jgi:predicted dehydrogenase
MASNPAALCWTHIHDSDFVQFLFPAAEERLFHWFHQGKRSNRPPGVTQYQVADGTVVHAEGSWAMTKGFGFNMSYNAVFERATADYDIARGSSPLMLFEEGQSPRVLQCEGGDGYVGELSHMIDSIQSGKPPTVVTPHDGLSSIEICEAEEQSVKTGQIVLL